MMNSIRPDALASLLGKGEAQNGKLPGKGERQQSDTEPRRDSERGKRVVDKDMIRMKFLTITLLSVAAINLHAETVIQQIGRAQDTMAQVEVARFQQEQADRAAKIADEIRQAALAAQAAREARDADLEKEIERCLAAG